MKDKGFILITSYLLLSVLSLYSLALFSRNSTFLQATERNQNKMVAFNMAESALDEAIVQLATNSAYTGTGTYTSMDSSSVSGGYQVTVSSPATTPDGLPNADTTIRQISVQGYAPSDTTTATAYETRSVTAYVEVKPPSLFDFAVFAKDDVQINGNSTSIIDSYNSTNADYDPNNPGLNGDVGTDSIAAATLSLIGNVIVKGDGMVGPSGDPAAVIDMGANTTMTGTQSAADSPQDFQAEAASGTDLGALTISGQTNYPLEAGSYTVSSLSITGQGKLTLNGAVKLYVTGTVNIAGQGVATSSNLPANFLLFATTSASVSLAGGGSLYAGVYAPLSVVSNTGGGELFGAVVSKEYQQSGNGKIHYDEALNEIVSSGNNKVSMQSWEESNTSLGS